MMTAETLLLLSGAALAGLLVVSLFAAWAWSSWLKLRGRELELAVDGGPVIGQRIDLADLKERVRRLEAIASGVDF